MKGRKRWRVPLAIHFPMGALTFLPAGRNEAAAFSVFVMVDTMSSAEEAHHQTQSLAIPASEIQQAKASEGSRCHSADVWSAATASRRFSIFAR